MSEENSAVQRRKIRFCIEDTLSDVSIGDVIIGPYGEELVTYSDPGLIHSVFRSSSFQIELLERRPEDGKFYPRGYKTLAQYSKDSRDSLQRKFYETADQMLEEVEI